MANVQLSNLNVGRLVIGVVAFIIIFKLFLGGGSSGSYGSSHGSSSWRSTWRLKIPSWAKHEVPQDRLGFMPLDETVEEMCAHYRWRPYPDRFHRRKIYDLIMMNDEFDALSLRMGEMGDQVDYFVVVESDLTFSDNEKPLHVLENWDAFSEFHHKMIRHTLNLTGKDFGGDAWGRESFSRNAMFDQVFPTLEDEQIATHGDVLIVGDVDEVVRPEVLTALRNCEIPRRVKLWTRFYYYSFQWLHPEGHAEWGHPDATFFDGLNDTVLPQDLRGGGTDVDVYSAGWHCSYCFSKLQDIVNKVKSFSHQEMNTPDFTSPAKILQRVRFGRDMFDRGNLYRIDNNRDVPGFVVRNADKFGYMLDRDAEDGGFEDAWDLLDEEEQTS
jgi:beta-1,4-mannosyl-glycoprotein beta-1,4-N-acetylglucosaminyltransferase